MAYTTAVRVSYYLLVFGGYVHMHVPRNTTTWVPGRVLARGGGQAGDPDACDGRLRRECDRVHDGLHRARDPRPSSPHLVAYTASVTHVSPLVPQASRRVCPALASCVDFAKCFVSGQLQQPSILVNILSTSPPPLLVVRLAPSVSPAPGSCWLRGTGPTSC